LAVGFNWPPDEPLYISSHEVDPNTGQILHSSIDRQYVFTGNANSDPPFGFITHLAYRGGQAVYTLRAGACTVRITFP